MSLKNSLYPLVTIIFFTNLLVLPNTENVLALPDTESVKSIDNQNTVSEYRVKAYDFAISALMGVGSPVFWLGILGGEYTKELLILFKEIYNLPLLEKMRADENRYMSYKYGVNVGGMYANYLIQKKLFKSSSLIKNIAGTIGINIAWHIAYKLKKLYKQSLKAAQQNTQEFREEL